MKVESQSYLSQFISFITNKVQNLFHLFYNAIFANPPNTNLPPAGTNRTIVPANPAESNQITYLRGKQHQEKGEYSEAMKCYYQAAKAGSTEASKSLDTFYKSALQLPNKPANIQLMCALGEIFEKLDWDGQSYERAGDLYSRAAEFLSPEANFRLAFLGETGKYKQISSDDILACYKFAADRGNEDAKERFEILTNAAAKNSKKIPSNDDDDNESVSSQWGKVVDFENIRREPRSTPSDNEDVSNKWNKVVDFGSTNNSSSNVQYGKLPSTPYGRLPNDRISDLESKPIETLTAQEKRELINERSELHKLQLRRLVGADQEVNPRKLFDLGWKFEQQGIYGNRDAAALRSLQESLSYYKKAADLGDVQAKIKYEKFMKDGTPENAEFRLIYYNVGLENEKGRDFPEMLTYANECFKKAAELGHPEAKKKLKNSLNSALE